MTINYFKLLQNISSSYLRNEKVSITFRQMSPLLVKFPTMPTRWEKLFFVDCENISFHIVSDLGVWKYYLRELERLIKRNAVEEMIFTRTPKCGQHVYHLHHTSYFLLIANLQNGKFRKKLLSSNKEDVPDGVGGNLLPGEYNGRNLIKENDFLLQKYWRSFSECEGISLVCVVCLHYNESQHHYECLLST